MSLLLGLFVCVFALTACGGDDDSPSTPPNGGLPNGNGSGGGSGSSGGNDPTSPVDQNIKPFIGYWTLNSRSNTFTYPYTDLVLFSDKKCYYKNLYNNSHGIYDWDYNPNNGLLATTSGNYGSWIVNIISGDSWSGASYWGSNESYTARKITDKNLFFQLMLIGKWVNVNDNTDICNLYWYDEDHLQFHAKADKWGIWDPRSMSIVQSTYILYLHGYNNALHEYYQSKVDMKYDDITDKLTWVVDHNVSNVMVNDYMVYDSIVVNHPYNYAASTIEFYLSREKTYKGTYKRDLSN